MAETLFKLDMNKIVKGLNDFNNKADKAMQMYLTTKAAQVQSDMQNSKPWTDRTGMAKLSLTARVSKPSEEVYRLTLAHGVTYGIWLELANEKNYAILAPTLQKVAPEIIQGLGQVMQVRI